MGNFSFGGAVLKNNSSPSKNLYNERSSVIGRNYGREVTPHITDQLQQESIQESNNQHVMLPQDWQAAVSTQSNSP